MQIRPPTCRNFIAPQLSSASQRLLPIRKKSERECGTLDLNEDHRDDANVKMCCNGIQIPRHIAAEGLRLFLRLKGRGHIPDSKGALCIYLREQNGIQVCADPESPITVSSEVDQCKAITVTPDTNTAILLEMDVAAINLTQHSEYPSGKRSRSESDLDDSESFSDSDSDSREDGGYDGYSDEDCDGDDDLADEVLHRDTTPGLNISSEVLEGLREHLLAFASDQVNEVRPNATYSAPRRDHKRPPSKIAKTHPQSVGREEGYDETDLHAGSYFCGYFHLACPYYQQDPLGFQDCLRQGSLRSISDVLRHLRRDHKLPIYCPLCRETFPKALDRDFHVRRRECEPNPDVKLHGLSHSQLVKLTKLAKQDRCCLGERRQWMRMCAALFPGADAPASPYLEQDIGLQVSFIHDFWATKGKIVMSEFLDTYASQHTEEEVYGSAIEDLYTCTLEHLINNALERKHSDDGNG